MKTTSPSAQPVLRAQGGVHNCATRSFFFFGIPEGPTSLTVCFTVQLFLLRKRLVDCSSTGPQCLCWPTPLQPSVYFTFLTRLSAGITPLLMVPEVLLILASVNKRPWWRSCTCHYSTSFTTKLVLFSTHLFFSVFFKWFRVPLI